MTTTETKGAEPTRRGVDRNSSLVRVSVQVPAAHARLMKDIAAAIRQNVTVASRIESALPPPTSGVEFETLADLFASLPDVSGPEYDEFFEDLEKFRSTGY
jgi:hypothetical protein